MAVEDHPLYPKWRAALERVVDMRERRDQCHQGTAAWTAVEAEYQQALREYDLVGREV